VSAGAIIAWFCWGALIGGLAYGLAFDLRRWWWRRQALRRIEADLHALFSDLARLEAIRDLLDDDPGIEEETEEALIIANGLGPTLDEIQELPEWWP
jgi:hypothetical protein